MVNRTFKSMRKASGLNQRTIAEKLGLHTRTVTAWESGKPDSRGKAPRPSWETCQRIAPLLNASAEAIANSFGLPSPRQKGWLEEGLKAGRFADVDAELPSAFVSLERLYHHRFGVCDTWWSVADRKPKDFVYCPDCGARQRVERVVDGNGDVVSGN